MSDCEGCEGAPAPEPGNPCVSFTDAHGKRIYRVVTAFGSVHFIADAVYEHESDAMRVVKGRVNPVVDAMEVEKVRSRVAVDAAQEEVELLGTELYHPNPNVVIVPKEGDPRPFNEFAKSFSDELEITGE